MDARHSDRPDERYAMRKLLFACLVAAFVACESFAAESGVVIPNRMLKAKEGEWVEYQVLGSMTQRQELKRIIEKDDDKVFVIDLTMLVDGNVVQTQENEFSFNDAQKEQQEMEAKEDLQLGTEKVTAKGKEIDAVVINTTLEDIKIKSYMSMDIPVTGLIKIEMNGEPYMEVTDFSE